MGKFLNGLLVGIGVGLFIAPQNGKETCRLIMERLAALRKSMPSEDDQHFSINASPPRIATIPLEPDQPIAMSSSEPLEQVTTSVAPADTEQMGKSPALASPSEQIATIPLEPDQPIAMSSSEPLEQVTISVAPADTEQMGKSPTLSSPSEQIATSPPEPDQSSATSSSEPLEQVTTSVAPADTEQMGKSPTLSSPSNRSGQTARRKASTRTSNTSKTRGHNK